MDGGSNTQVPDNLIQENSSPGNTPGEVLAQENKPNSVIHQFLIEKEPVFVKLAELRRKGWANPQGDEFFKNRQQQADSGKSAAPFFKMMKEIGEELELATHALTALPFRAENIRILDLCMAPGGYTACALKYNAEAQAFGISLPHDQGGHEVLFTSPRSQVLHLDITMLASEFGVSDIPHSHPDHDAFITDKPFLGQSFHLIFCDGQVLRTHQFAEHRDKLEATRLTVSQLILALQRIEAGGTMIVLLHKVEMWNVADLLRRFSDFSAVQLFKSKKKHTVRSSFSLIARNVQPDTYAAKSAVEAWKETWCAATFGGEGKTGTKEKVDEQHVHKLLENFGDTLAELGKPIWEIQANALKTSSFIKSA